jgi:hypothetical protein
MYLNACPDCSVVYRKRALAAVWAVGCVSVCILNSVRPLSRVLPEKLTGVYTTTICIYSPTRAQKLNKTK